MSRPVVSKACISICQEQHCYGRFEKAKARQSTLHVNRDHPGLVLKGLHPESSRRRPVCYFSASQDADVIAERPRQLPLT